MNKNIKINLEKLQIKTRLGVYEEERKDPINVEFNISFSLPAVNLALDDDDYANYICYDNIARLVHEFCADKEFKLLEYMANQIFMLIKKELPDHCKLKLSARKSYTPGKYQVDFASCEISDE